MSRSGTAIFAGLRRRLVRWSLFVALAFGPVCASRVEAQTSAALGSDAVRAVFLINFLGFTKWPGEALPADAPYVIGVAGGRALEEELLSLAERRLVQDRRIRVVRVKNSRDLVGCHLLYINPSPAAGEENAPGEDELLPLVRRQPVLTVSSSPSFLAEGGIINLVAGEQGRLAFEISTDHAQAAGLVLSSRLLSLARIVNPSAPPPAPAKKP